MKNINPHSLGKKLLLAIALLLNHGLLSAQSLPKQLVLYFPFETIKQEKIKDFSGQHNDGTASAIIVSNSPSLVSMQKTRQLSFAIWIKPASIPHEFPVILGKGGNQPPDVYGGYEFTLNSNGDNDLVFVSGARAVYTGGANGRWINNHLGEWIHVAFTMDEQTKVAKFYVNGQPTNDEVVENIDAEVNFDVPNNLYIGTPDPAHNTNRAKFDGSMRELMLFNRALTAQEVMAIYTSTKKRLQSKNQLL